MSRPGIHPIIFVIGIPTIYGLLLRLAFGNDDLFKIMSMSFLFCVPTIIGVLTVYFSDVAKVERFAYRFFMPWVPVMLLLFITIIFTLEGWACWLMALPLFLSAASIGGLIGGYFKLRKRSTLKVSLLALLPFFAAPVEHTIASIPGTYKAYTFTDIQAPAEKIWSNVTRVREIKADQDKGYLTSFLGFPRPVKAELNYEGVGAYREAKFTNGLTFHETVSEYIHQKKMVFSIKAYPHEIPSTTMDEHVVIGGDYFDVLNGTYELEQLNNNTYRLHLYSHFKLSTTFNFYASWWARWIMQDIQNNILQVEKKRAEGE